MYKFIGVAMMIFVFASTAFCGNGNIYKWKTKDGHYMYSNKVNDEKPNMEVICKEAKFNPAKHQVRLEKEKKMIENMGNSNTSVYSNNSYSGGSSNSVEVPIPYIDPTTPHANARRIRDAINAYQKNIELRNRYLEAISK